MTAMDITSNLVIHGYPLQFCSLQLRSVDNEPYVVTVTSQYLKDLIYRLLQYIAMLLSHSAQIFYIS